MQLPGKHFYEFGQFRLDAEERVLSQDARWRAYSESTRYRLVPGLW